MTPHANRGIEWQRLLEERHDGYRRERQALVWPVPPRVRVCSRVGPTGQFRAAWVAHGPPDYAGVLAGGRGVVFDAKDCAGERWSLGELPLHQARDLEAANDRGAAAFVALRFAGSRGWVLPWALLGPRWWAWQDGAAKRGQASVLEGDVGVQMRELGDWLPCVQP